MTTYAAKYELVEPGQTTTGTQRFYTPAEDPDTIRIAAEATIWSWHPNAPRDSTLTVGEITRVHE